MSSKQDERRKYERFASEGIFRIFSSVTCCKYSVKLSDIGPKGAFIKTPHLPKVDEIITYVILNNRGNEIFVGNARVSWIKDPIQQEDRGFGIELDEELKDEILEELKDN